MAHLGIKNLAVLIKVFCWCNNCGLDMDDNTKDVRKQIDLRATQELEFKIVGYQLDLGKGDIQKTLRLLS